MGLFDFLKSPDINEGVARFESTADAVLLDVRTAEEYAEGRIPGSINIPLHELERAKGVIPNPATPIFTYCLSGARSGQAVSQLKAMGYTEVHNLGGISRYDGKVVR